MEVEFGEMSKLKFSIRTVFWIMLVVAAFLGGRASMSPAIHWHVEELAKQKAIHARAQAMNSINADRQLALAKIRQRVNSLNKMETQMRSDRVKAGNEIGN